MAHEAVSTIDVDASAEELFAIATDVESFPEWLTDIKEVDVLETDDDGLVTAARMLVDVKLRQVEYVLEYEHDGPHRVAWTNRPGGDIKLIAGSYQFDVNDDGGTTVTYELSMDPGFPVPGMLMRRATKHIIDQALRGLKSRAET
jgi:ribosome-associated toxin RatA of RatAB toxin-antitoxin module